MRGEAFYWLPLQHSACRVRCVPDRIRRLTTTHPQLRSRLRLSRSPTSVRGSESEWHVEDDGVSDVRTYQSAIDFPSGRVEVVSSF